MPITPRFVAFVLALSVSGITTAFLSLLPVGVAPLLVVATLSFAATFILVYIASEMLIFRQITQIYDALDELKRTDVKVTRKKIKSSSNPLKQLNDEIFDLASNKQAQINELRQLESFRRDFLADVSHELKTPIFAAQGFVHTLIDGAVDDEAVRDRFLQKAARSLDGLSLLVQDLLTLSKLETGTLKMHASHFDLYPLLIEVFEQLEDKATQRGVDLRLTRKSETSAYVRADRDRIRQVLTNLIENGIHHGRPGGRMRVNVTFQAQMVQIGVKDDGPGIPAEHINRIFERFYRIEKSRSKDRGGSGLGLAIVKHIVEAHDSFVEVISKPDRGTTFRFRLPLGDPQQEHTPTRPARPPADRTSAAPTP